MKKKLQYIAEIVLIALLVIMSIIIFLFRNEMKSLGVSSYLGVFFLCFLANSSILLPSPSLMIAASCSFVLAPFWVAIVGSLGSTCGEFTGYIFGNVTNNLLVKSQAVFDKIKGWIRNPLIMIFILALLPLPLFDIAGIYAGGTKVNYVKFFLACFLGKFIKMLVYIYVIGIMEELVAVFL